MGFLDIGQYYFSVRVKRGLLLVFGRKPPYLCIVFRRGHGGQVYIKGKKIEIMKKLMTMVGAMMMVAAANASEVMTVAFNEARVNVPARVRFVKGENYGFSVEAKDSVIARAVRCSVKDGVLRLSFGNALQPGESKFDAKKGVYYYGVNPTNQVFADENGEDDMVITVVAPDMPKFKTSSDYVAVTVTAVEEVGNSRAALTMNE